MLYGSCALLDSEQNTSEALHVFLEMHEMHFRPIRLSLFS